MTNPFDATLGTIRSNRFPGAAFPVLAVLLPLVISGMNITASAIKYPIYITIAALLGINYLLQPNAHSASSRIRFLVITLLGATAVYAARPTAITLEKLPFIAAGFCVFFACEKLSLYQFRRIVITVTATAIPLSIYAIIQKHTTFHLDFLRFSADGGQVTSTLAHKNDLAMYLNATWPLALIILTRNPILATISIPLQVYAVAISGSRAGILILGLNAITITLVLAIRFRKYKSIYAPPIFLIAALLISILKTPVTEIIKREPWSNQTRTECYSAALSMIRNKPLGRGIGGFERDFPKYKSTWLKENTTYQHYPHPMNEVLFYAIEYGVIGGAIFLAFIIWTIWVGFARGLFISGILSVSFLSIVAHSQIDLCLQHPAPNFLFWMLAGVIARQTAKPTSGWRHTPPHDIPVWQTAPAIFLCLCIPLTWKIWHENYEVHNLRFPITTPLISTLAKYAEFSNQIYNNNEDHPNNRALLSYLKNEVPSYRYLDYLMSIHYYCAKDIVQAKYLFNRFAEQYKIQPRMAKFRDVLFATQQQ